ncbi:MAG: prolipoprotein diacylglyceryl transferase, partial [Dermatophilaceae bacterium]|nr:prolipoprotein diacylglyceryl transferase [Dermatophilaceae bacterium]
MSTHDALVGAGLVATVAVFGFEKRRRAMTDERLWVVVALALAWGAVFARLGTWIQHVDLSQNDALAQHWLYGSRSILGGLTGAYLGALYGKEVTGYRERTGALFAPAVAAGMAIGRIGCLLAESPGAATGQAWGVVLNKTDAALMGSLAN